MMSECEKWRVRLPNKNMFADQYAAFQLTLHALEH